MARKTNPVQRLQRRYAGGPSGPNAWDVRNRELEDSWGARVVRPVLDNLGKIAGRIGSKKDQNQLGDLLAKAGYPGGLGVGQLQAVRIVLAVGLPIAAFLIGLAIRFIFGIGQILTLQLLALFALGFAAIGYMSLPFILRRQVKKRQREISKQLPDVLDLITIAVEAGMGFDSAMDRVGQRYIGAMGEELVRTNNEIRMGRPWNDAMRDLGERTGVDDLRSLVTALLQSRELGVNLANVLQAQSLRLREERARRAREAAQKTPTKIIFPLVGCIFPTLFIVLMGPAVLKALKQVKEAGVFGMGQNK
ncbi:MAG: type II secretion system F family protein [Armatimonadetes bacterium]|nr:type II secretion system F family protein [Armatimonadota bacterium]